SVAELRRIRGFCAAQAASTTRLLHLMFLFLVVILNTGDPRARLVGQNPSRRAPWPYVRPRLSRLGEVGDIRIGECADRTADVAPAVIDASRPPLEFGRVHPHGSRHHADADRLEALQPDIAMAEGLHWRHRIGLTRGPPDFLRLRVAGDSYVLRHL